jgi:hypothetical protein
MNNIEIKKITATNKNKELFRLTSNSNEIYIKLNNIHLPFNYQKYKGNLYVNAEILQKDENKLKIIKLFEELVCIQMKDIVDNKQFISIIKNRKQSYHVKLMLKKHKKQILIDTENDFDINMIEEYHKLNKIYDIIIKPEIVWIKDDSYGIVFYLMKIINL